jgi:hypothetical protein
MFCRGVALHAAMFDMWQHLLRTHRTADASRGNFRACAGSFWYGGLTTQRLHKGRCFALISVKGYVL